MRARLIYIPETTTGTYGRFAALGIVSGRRSARGGNPSRPGGIASDQVYGGSIPGHSGGQPAGPRQEPAW